MDTTIVLTVIIGGRDPELGLGVIEGPGERTDVGAQGPVGFPQIIREACFSKELVHEAKHVEDLYRERTPCIRPSWQPSDISETNITPNHCGMRRRSYRPCRVIMGERPGGCGGRACDRRRW